MDLLNLIYAALSIGLGCFGWLAPRYTLGALDLTMGETTMGASEIRASVGALFVGMGLGALFLGTPTAYLMLAFCWIGAAVGRGTSILLDGSSRKKWIYFWVEAVVGVTALVTNWSALT